MTTCISAPGKVLLAGGYLVLDRAYSGVVISTSSRFYTTVRPAGVGRVNRILVQSPQFDSASWDYSARVVDRVYKVVPEEYVCLSGSPVISLTDIQLSQVTQAGINLLSLLFSAPSRLLLRFLALL